ncbi:MAG: N-6 DNA methylase [Caldisericia bacterium]|nr:N-6 DNA methylase [Caldisericia bacterium]
MEQLKQYLREVSNNLKEGNSSELSYRTHFENLFKAILPKGFTIKQEPAGREEGKPDFIVMKDNVPFGIIETKDVGKKLASSKSDLGQLKRYYNSMSNVILTDYLEFRWYARLEDKPNEKDEIIEPRTIFHLATDLGQGKLKPDPQAEENFAKLVDHFINAKVKTVSNPTELAERMASIACDIRDSLLKAMKDEHPEGDLHNELKAIRTDLLHTITEDQFADMYAQTICYGLFAARIEAGREIDWASASDHIPLTNPFLRRVFKEFREILKENVTWATGTLINLLNKSDIEAILKPEKKTGFAKDPIFYFYEPFLSAYNPGLREKRGVYYTPEPVVSWIVKSVDILLEEKFGLKNGLATKERVTEDIPQLLILDPAAGTGTFLYEVLNTIYKRLRTDKFGRLKDDEVQRDILERIYGFELMMAPYSIAHLKLGLLLKEHGYTFSNDRRLNIFLTNTLEPPAFKQDPPGSLFGKAVSDEVNSASEVKKVKPIMVVLGNPPYSGHSANSDIEWINRLLKGEDTSDGGKKTANYFQVDGKDLGEKNPKWLNDDYVRFIRWAQWKIEKTGSGILAFITNHGYLDNPTFRGMRQSLLETFDEIYVLDLHGNAKKKEACPDGSKDENVFDIQQGVAIGLFVKTGKKKPPHPDPLLKGEGKSNNPSPGGKGNEGVPSSSYPQIPSSSYPHPYARVFHADLYGQREIFEDGALAGGKYCWLLENNIKSTGWKQLLPSGPFYMFVPSDTNLDDEYHAWPSIVELMPVNSVGIVTSRDDFVVNYEKTKLLQKINSFINSDLSNEDAKKQFLSDKDKLTLSKVRPALRNEKNIESFVSECLYRPFDIRFMFYHNELIERSRKEVMRHMLAGPNLGLITNRQVNDVFRHILCTKNTINDCTVSLATRERSYLFPLYLYPDTETNTLKIEKRDWPAGKGGRTPNLSKKIVSAFESRLGIAFVPDGKGNITEKPPHPNPLLEGEGYHGTSLTGEGPGGYPGSGSDGCPGDRADGHYAKDGPNSHNTKDGAVKNLPPVGEGARRADEGVLTFGPEDIFHYIYAVLHSPTYRTRYADFLKYDFPRAPLTSKIGLFSRLAKKGQELASLHLLESEELDDTIASYPAFGNDIIEKVSFDENGNRVYINKSQYFDGVSPEVWNFMVGGYQVAQKWLKDRKGRSLDHGDRVIYAKIVTALSRTIGLMGEIDKLIEEEGGWPIE